MTYPQRLLLIERAGSGCRGKGNKVVLAITSESLPMPPADLIDRTANHVQTVLSGDGTGHDWHVYRVWKMAQRIGRAEEPISWSWNSLPLLHDIADWKLHDGDSSVGPTMAKEWLDSLGLEPSISEQVWRIIGDISFKGAAVEQPTLTLEGRVVQDADRLDAMGAIGIARAFAYGGAKGRVIHDPALMPTEHRTAEVDGSAPERSCCAGVSGRIMADVRCR